jgi:serine phosphatase RsbU (regulator of sigma subunit)/ligand-binding sensor domain-containing protein
MTKQLWLVFPFVLLLALTAQADEGQWKTYTVADGLVSPDVTTIFQDRLGNLWFGARDGDVSRFDGENFRSFTKKDGLPGSSIKQILEDKRGYLWFITSSPEPSERCLVCRYDGKGFIKITERDGLPGGFSDAALMDKNGNLWIANEYGLTKYDGERFQHFGDKEFQRFIAVQGGTDRQIHAIFESRNGDIWLGGGPRIERRGGPGRMRQQVLPYVILYDGSKFHYFPLEFFQTFSPNFSFKKKSSIIRNNEELVKKKREGIISTEDFPSSIDAIAEDDAGNLWFGGRSVLLKYDGKRFERFDSERQSTVEEDSSRSLVTSAAVGHGEILLTWKEPLGPTGEPLFTVGVSLPPGPPGRAEDLPALSAVPAQAGATAAQAGNRETTSSEPHDSKAESKNYRYQHRMVRISIDSIFKDSHGNLWFNNRGFISRWDGKELKHFVIPENWEEIKEQIGLNKNESPHKAKELASRLRRDEGLVNEANIFYPGYVVLEDLEGNLWFKSENGAHRLDSKCLHPDLSGGFQTFTVDDGLGSDNIAVILEAMDGKFWFGHDNGVTLFDPAPPVIQNFTTRGALGSNSVRFIHEDKEGFVWFSVRGGVAKYDGEKLQYFSEKQMNDFHPRLPDIRFPPEKNFTVNILDGGKGSLWFVGDGTHLIFRYKDGVFQRSSIWPDRVRPINRYDRPPVFGLDNRIFTVDSKGNLWLAIGESPIRCVPFGHQIPPPVPPVGGSHIRLMDGESFQLLTVDGFQVVGPNSRRDTPSSRRGDRRGITDIHVDSQGNIWFATSDEGVKRYDGTSLKTFTTVDGLKSNNIRKIFEDRRGNLWFAGEAVHEAPHLSVGRARSQTLTKYNGKSFQSFSVANVTGAPVAIHQDTHDLISFIYPYAIAKYNPLPPSPLIPLTKGGRGVVDKGDYDGKNFELLEGDKVFASLTNDFVLWLGGPPGDRVVVASTTDSQGNLWLATSNGVIKYDGKQFTTYTTEDGLLVNDILDVREDSKGNLWFATWGGGVALYNGETFQAITTRQGLVHNNVRSIFEDSRGNMWFATDGGITKYTLRADILPRIKLTKVIADEVYTEFNYELQLPPKVRRLAFEYQGISFQRVNLLYTHKLEGYEEDWSQPSTEEQVSYDGLRPGNYTFLVKALRAGSAYSNPPVVVKFTIMQPFWTQSGFYLPVSIGGVMLATFVFLITRLVIQWRRAATLRAELRQKEESEIQRVKKELNDARDMQMGLLPRAAPHIDEFELAGASLPATEVGGDFYDYLTLSDNLVGIALADVSGKGLRGAMNAVLTNGMLREVVQLEARVGAILSRLNTDLRPLLYSSMFIALNIGVLNPRTKQIQYTNAGQPYPIIKRGGEVEEVELGEVPLGLITGVTYDEETIDLYPGDYVIFYTDGLVEAMNSAEEIYGFDRLKETICNAEANFSAEEMIQHILQDVHAFVGEAEQYDDMTVVVLRCKE